MIPYVKLMYRIILKKFRLLYDKGYFGTSGITYAGLGLYNPTTMPGYNHRSKR